MSQDESRGSDGSHRTGSVGEVQDLGEAITFAFSGRAPVAIVIAGTAREIDELTRADDSEFLRRTDRVVL